MSLPSTGGYRGQHASGGGQDPGFCEEVRDHEPAVMVEPDALMEINPWMRESKARCDWTQWRINSGHSKARVEQ